MTDYSKLSDEEISKAVGDILKLEWANLDQNYNGLCYWKDGGLFVFNPIKDPQDAWPIITGNKIDINWGDDVHPALKGAVITSRGKLSATHDNPLRAAMIVFLEMQEDNHD
ncbi:TPA: phage protein NinX family protein [Klebsiella pneumoniae]